MKAYGLAAKSKKVFGVPRSLLSPTHVAVYIIDFKPYVSILVDLNVTPACLALWRKWFMLKAMVGVLISEAPLLPTQRLIQSPPVNGQ